MSSYLCFICHNSVNINTFEGIREKYKDVVGMHLCPDSVLCYICSHIVNKLWMFKSLCLKRSLEYRVLFSAKGSVSLQSSNIEIHTLCTIEHCCQHNMEINTKSYHFNHELNYGESNHSYVKLEKDPYYSYNENTSFDVDNKNAKGFIDNEEYSNNYFKEWKEEHSETSEERDENDQHLLNEDLSHNGEGFLNETTSLNEATSMDLNIYDNKKTKISKKGKRKARDDYERIILSVEEQKTELEARRKEKKYIEAEFKCYNCALGFLFKDTYQAHMMRHEESNGSYRCATCGLRFAWGGELRAHSLTHAARLRCSRCARCVPPRRARAHAASCAAPPVHCHLCARTFREASGLQQHLKRFHQSKSSSRTYPCSVCGKIYNNQSDVRTHMIKHINRKFSCDKCPATFSSPYSLTQHCKRHDALPQTHYCESCGLSYSSRKSLLAHKRNAMNHQMTLFKCPICGRVCPSQRSLASHIQTVHSTSKDFACPHCSARYTSRKSLVRHLKVHDAKPPAKTAVCHLCGTKFTGNNKLNRHLKMVCEKAKLEEQLASYYGHQTVH